MATTKKTAAKKTATKTAVETGDFMSFANGGEWAETAKEQFDTMMSSFSGNFDEMREHAEELAETAQARIKTAQDLAAQTNTRLMEAAQEEMTGAVQFVNELGQAKSFADALNIQQSYWKNLFETRMTRAREMTEATVEVARETMTPVETPFASFKAYEKFFAFPARS